MEMILSTEPWNELWAQQLKEQGLQKKTGWNSLVLVTPHCAGSTQITKSCQASISTSEMEELKLHFSQAYCTIKQSLA